MANKNISNDVKSEDNQSRGKHSREENVTKVFPNEETGEDNKAFEGNVINENKVKFGENINSEDKTKSENVIDEAKLDVIDQGKSGNVTGVFQGHTNYSLENEEEKEGRSKKNALEKENETAKRKHEELEHCKEGSLDQGSVSYSPVGDGTGDGTYSSWMSWLKRETTWNSELIPIKVIQFLYSGGTNSILPYLTLHMQELGLTMQQIGVIYAFLPIATIIGPPISGMVADRTGNYKFVVLLNMIVTVILHVALLYLPGEGINKLTSVCGGMQNLTLSWDKCRDCHSAYDGMNFTVTLKDCRYTCEHASPTTFEICFAAESKIKPGNEEFCQLFNLTDEIVLNGTVLATQNEDTCLHSWSQIRREEHVYQGATCSSECPVECVVGGAPSCQSEGAAYTIFWVYFLMRLLATFFLSSLFTMMDAMTIAIVKEHGGEYGKQRFLFILGMATIPLLAGFLNDWDAGANGTSHYLPAMYLGAALCIASAILIARLNFTVETAEDNILQDLKKLVTKPEINLYFVVILILGSNWGFIESYLFLYMGKLGSPNYLMGLTMTVGSIIGMPVMLVADQVVNLIGRHNVFIVSFFAYALRHFGYSFISTPWMVFPFELLEVFTYQLMWVAAITFCPILAPPGLLATLTGVAGAVHFSVGRGVGSFIGGQLISKMDIPGAFRCYGGIAIVSGILYILLHVFYFKKKIAAREQELDKIQRESEGTEMTLH